MSTKDETRNSAAIYGSGLEGELPDVLAGVAGEPDEFGLLDPGFGGGADGVVEGAQGPFVGRLGASAGCDGSGDGSGRVIHERHGTTTVGQVDLHANSNWHSVVGISNYTEVAT